MVGGGSLWVGMTFLGCGTDEQPQATPVVQATVSAEEFCANWARKHGADDTAEKQGAPASPEPGETTEATVDDDRAGSQQAAPCAKAPSPCDSDEVQAPTPIAARPFEPSTKENSGRAQAGKLAPAKSEVRKIF